MCFSPYSEEEARVRELQDRIAAMESAFSRAPDMSDQILQQVQLAALGPVGRTRKSTFSPPPAPLGFQVMESILKGGK